MGRWQGLGLGMAAMHAIARYQSREGREMLSPGSRCNVTAADGIVYPSTDAQEEGGSHERPQAHKSPVLALAQLAQVLGLALCH